MPQLPSIKDILKIISGKIDVFNDKIGFIVQHFILDQSQLPHDLFFYDDLDEEKSHQCV